MKILAMDTSSVIATCAVMEDSCLIGETLINHKWTHSQKLLPIIDDLLKACELNIRDMDAFACSRGPGSFTGLRIGVSTVKGFAQALQKPVCGVSTLEALAYNLYGAKGIVCPIIDAQRDFVYGAAYRWDKGVLTLIEDYKAIPIDQLFILLKRHNEHVNFLGDGCKLHGDRISKAGFTSYSIAPASHLMPRASSVAALAMEKLKNGGGEHYDTLKPYYIRKSQAEVEYDKKQIVTMGLMNEKDIDGVIEIENLSFHTPWSRKSMEDELSNKLAFYVVARIDERPIGYGGVWHILSEGHITNVAVHPDFRDKGISHKIMDEMLRISKKRGIEKLTLEVRPANHPALALYRHYGFKERGVRKNYYSDTHEDALIMWKEM